MNYTAEQEEKIYSNLNQIIAYINDKIQPLIPEGDTIKVDFKDMDGRLKCSLYVNDWDITGYVGFVQIHFYEGKGYTNSTSVYNHVDYAMEFVYNWNVIKQELIEKLDEKISKHNAIISVIDNFEV